MVNPVPHKAPLQSGVHVDRLPVLVHVAVAVAHGMCVLAQDQGPPFTRFRYGLLDLLHPETTSQTRAYAHVGYATRMTPTKGVIRRPHLGLI